MVSSKERGYGPPEKLKPWQVAEQAARRKAEAELAAIRGHSPLALARRDRVRFVAEVVEMVGRISMGLSVALAFCFAGLCVWRFAEGDAYGGLVAIAAGWGVTFSGVAILVALGRVADWLLYERRE